LSGCVSDIDHATGPGALETNCHDGFAGSNYRSLGAKETGDRETVGSNRSSAAAPPLFFYTGQHGVERGWRIVAKSTRPFLECGFDALHWGVILQ
jgi:hypothetical protein